MTEFNDASLSSAAMEEMWKRQGRSVVWKYDIVYIGAREGVFSLVGCSPQHPQDFSTN